MQLFLWKPLLFIHMCPFMWYQICRHKNIHQFYACIRAELKKPRTNNNNNNDDTLLKTNTHIHTHTPTERENEEKNK